MNDLERRIQNSPHLEQTEKTILGFLAREPLTAKEIVNYLMDTPYDWNQATIIHALTALMAKGLLRIDSINPHPNGIDFVIRLTYAMDWALRI